MGDLKVTLLGLLLLACCWAWPLKHSINGVPTRLDVADYPPIQRLPRDFKVISYHLTLHPYFEFPGYKYDAEKELRFDGLVEIKLRPVRNVRDITINSQNLDLQSVWVFDDEENYPISLYDVNIIESAQLVNISTVTPLKKGREYLLKIQYSGPINPSIDGGLYYSNYHGRNENGTLVKRTMIATFFEPFRSRKVFPNFDDPYFKAVFSLKLRYPKNADVFHNVAEVKEEKNFSEYKEITFKETPLMSSYLLAFAVGEFDKVTSHTKRNIPVSSISFPEISHYLNQSAVTGAHCVDAMEELVGVPYSLPKLDNIEMLYMGSSSAMENWGLIVYTRFLSQHPFATPATARYTKRSLMCHEIAHQWFGDLVTADHWGQEFLHESFAAYFQNIANLLFQESNDDDENFPNLIAANTRTAALEAAEKGNHAVVADQAYFDSITYASGGSMLTMTDYVLGKRVFRSGLKRYLEKKQYGSATHEDLFAALSEANGDKSLCGNITVTQFLSSFFLQPKHPVVLIRRRKGKHELSQTSTNSSDGTGWFVPLFVSEIGKEDDYKTVWLLPDNTLCGPLLDGAKNYIFNTKGRSFARFVYDEQYLASLKEEELKALSEESQTALVHDLKWSLARRKIAISDQYLGLITTLTKGVENVTPFVALEAINLYERFKNEFANTYEYDLYTKYFGHFLVDVYSEELWDDRSIRKGFYSKPLLFDLVVEDLANARHEALEKFGQFRRACSDSDIETCNTLAADTRRAVYCAAAVSGDAGDILFLRDYLKKHDEVKDTLFYFEYEYADINAGLACLNEKGLKDFLDEAVENSYTKFFEALLENKKDYVSKAVEKYLNHVDLTEKFDEKPDLFEKVLAVLTKNYTDGECLYHIHGISKLKHNMDLFKVLAKAELKIRDVRKAEDDNEKIRDEVLRYIYNKYVPIGKLVWSKRVPQYDYADLHYTLDIEPDYSTEPISTYNGVVTIEFTGTKNAKTFHINSHRHVIKELTFSINNLPQATKVSRDYENGIVTLTAGSVVQKYDKVIIRIVYTGYVFDQPQGFFYQRSGNEKRSNRFFLSTWFPKGPAARSFAPCLDEPTYKAIWTVSVTHPSELVALSNGAPDSTTYLGNNLVKTTFKPSPKISSYLLGLTIGPYASIQKSTDDGVEVRVWAEVGLEKYGYVALNATVGTLNYLGKYLGLSYAELHDKLDLVLNPEWNGFGTENFGVIIGNANVLLYKETVHDLAHKRNAYRKAAHEVAHQWFGNTVSFKFFNYGFVSEGFASFFETEVVNSVLGWGEAETVHNLEAGLHLDENAKDLDTVITADNKVHDTFNWTKQQIYTKAQGILHSLKAVVGEDVFKKALQRYIKKFKWANVDDQDLWSVFQELADANNIKDWNNQPLSIKKFMDFYTRQVSYPVTVLQLDGNTATVVENVNLHNETDLPPSDFTYTWHTPIVSSKGKVNWAEVGARIENYEPVGYQSYTRVIYENADEEKLNHLYNSGSEIQRAKLVSDYFNLFKSTRFSGRVGLENFLNLLKNLAIEESPIVWSYGAEALTYILEKSKVNKTRLEQAKKFVSSLFDGRTGTDETGQWSERLPHILNLLAVRINDAAFNKSANEEFEKFVTKCLHNVENALDCRQTPPEHRVAVFASALGATENIKELQSLRDFAGGLKNRVFARKIRQLLADAVAHSHLSTNNAFFVVTVDCLINDPEEEVARFFDIKSSFDDTQNELAKWVADHGWKFVDTPHFKSILKALVKDWASKEKLDQFDNIRWPAKSDPNMLRTARSAILENIKWEEDYGAKLSAWLSSYGHYT